MTFSSMALAWKVLCLLHTVWGTNLQNSEKNMTTTLKEAHVLYSKQFLTDVILQGNMQTCQQQAQHYLTLHSSTACNQEDKWHMVKT
jgi:hypothetical protein